MVRAKRGREETDAAAPPSKKGKTVERPSRSNKLGKAKQVDQMEDEEMPEDEEPDEDEEQKERRSPRLSHRLMPATQEEMEKVAAGTKADEEVVACASAIMLANDPALRNAVRIAKKIFDLKAARKVEPYISDNSELRLGDALANQAVRDIRPTTRKRDNVKNFWRLSFSEADAVTDAKGTDTNVSYTSMLAGDAPSTEVDKFHNELARIYSTWPWEINTLTSATKQQLAFLAAANVYARPMIIDEVTHSNTITYQTKVHYINAETGAHERFTVSATATEMVIGNVTVPPLPSITILRPKDQTTTQMNALSPYHTAAPDLSGKKLGAKQKTSRQAQLTAEDAVYWVASQLQGLIATPARMKELSVMYRTQIGLQKAARTQSGIYGGMSDLYWFHYITRDHSTGVAPTQRVARDMHTGPWDLMIYVHSLNASRATPVMETIVQLYCAGHDIRTVWIEAAKMADLVNMEISDGVAPASQCDCDDEMTGRELHPCEGCAAPTLCKTRAYDSKGRLACVKCNGRDKIGLGGRPANESLAAHRSHASLWRSFKGECVVRNQDPQGEGFQEIFGEAWADVKARLPGGGERNMLQEDELTTYRDEYTQKTYDLSRERTLVGNNPSRRRYTPSGITVDAVRRQGSPAQASLKHSKGNLRITSNVCQLAKGSFNVGAIHEIGRFKRLSEAEQSSEAVQNALIDTTNNMALVNLKRRYINNGSGTEAEKYAKVLAESTAGRPTPDEHGPWEEEAKKYVLKRVPLYHDGGESIWDGDSWAAAMKCARSTSMLFGVKLYQLPDGTLWVGTKHSAPEKFDRNGVGMFCIERLARMKIICNKKWRTIDSWGRLYREIIFQYCCSLTEQPDLQWLKTKYGDRLRLPMVLTKHNPIRLSVAHRTHGFGMATGWVTDADDVQERIDNDHKNNMLMETWLVNSSKLDMAEEYYSELDEILCAVDITDKSIYDPELSLTGFVGQPAEDLLAGSKEDDFTRAPFDKSMEENEKDSGEYGEQPEEDDSDAEDAEGDRDGRKVDAEKKASMMSGIADLLMTLTADAGLSQKLHNDNHLKQLMENINKNANAGDEEAFGVTMGEIYEKFVSRAG